MNKTTIKDIINEYKSADESSQILISNFIQNIVIVCNDNNQSIFNNDKNEIYKILLDNIIYISSIEFNKKKDFVKLLTLYFDDSSSLYLSLYLKFLYSINILKFPNEYKINLLDNDMFISPNIVISNIVFLSTIKGLNSKDVLIRIKRFQQRVVDDSSLKIQQYIHTIYTCLIIVDELYKEKTIKSIEENFNFCFINKFIIIEENLKKINTLWFKSYLLYLRKYYSYRFFAVDELIQSSNNLKKKYDELIILNIAFYCDELWLKNQTYKDIKSQYHIQNEDTVDTSILSSICTSIFNTLKNVIIDSLKLIESTSNSKNSKENDIDKTFLFINNLFTPLISVKLLSEGVCFNAPKCDLRIMALKYLVSSSTSSLSNDINLHNEYQTKLINNVISIISDVIMLDKIASVRIYAYQLLLKNPLLLNTKVMYNSNNIKI